MQQRFFIADLIACSTCFGHNYAHHQELKSIIQWLCLWYFVLWFSICWSGVELSFSNILQTGHITLSSTPDQQLENHSTKYHRQQPPYNTLELLMMGIVVPETCWASNKICNKNLCCIQLAFYFHILKRLLDFLEIRCRNFLHQAVEHEISTWIGVLDLYCLFLVDSLQVSLRFRNMWESDTCREFYFMICISLYFIECLRWLIQ